MPAKQHDLQPDLTTPLADTPLNSEQEFHKNLKAIFSVSKRELDDHIRDNADAPQKRGRKPKEKAQ